MCEDNISAHKKAPRAGGALFIRRCLFLLNENGSVTIEELARRFGVSEMTIRRDLDKYRRVGQVKRCRGGAVLRGDNVGEVEYQKKRGAFYKAVLIWRTWSSRSFRSSSSPCSQNAV